MTAVPIRPSDPEPEPYDPPELDAYDAWDSVRAWIRKTRNPAKQETHWRALAATLRAFEAQIPWTDPRTGAVYRRVTEIGE